MSSADGTGGPDQQHRTGGIVNKQEMYDTFQAWALQNYGDSGKTKTVTRRKYDRIVRILAGVEQASTENSKFRIWVKAKGFRLGPLDGERGRGEPTTLFVPTRLMNDPNSSDNEKGYKRVAMVEDFFDIIHGVHVEMDGRGGKHAGQKRTYRAIAETYAFLPREAVTRFLMSCADCQKRMHLGGENFNTNNNNSNHVTNEPPAIDFSVPITQTYLNHIRNKGFLYHDEESMSSGESEVSTGRTHSPLLEEGTSPKANELWIKEESAFENGQGPNPLTANDVAATETMESEMESLKDEGGAINMSNKTSSQRLEEKVIKTERKRRASDEISLDSSTKASESGNVDDLQGGKDEEDDDDNEEDEKMPSGHEFDSERLKAFNMFVRLFVDENLDRMVPISKQPKDKIQAILEACDRQFPEFHERSRKRIRTYLKSCRRMRRSKEQNGWEPLRPTPPHLTSAAAESLLAQACENESNNAKRMRMGLEPLPTDVVQNGSNCIMSHVFTVKETVTDLPISGSGSIQTRGYHINKITTKRKPAGLVKRASAVHQNISTSSSVTSSAQTSQTQSQAPQAQSQSSTLDRPAPSGNDFIRHQPAPPTFRPPPEFHPPFFANSNGIFRPGFPTGYQHPAHHHPPIIQTSTIQQNSVQNGPTDLSMKKQNSKNQLSANEVATIKQLIAGYRESAAFLYRSADELEQLLLQQN